MKKLLLFVIACTLGLFGTVSAQETVMVGAKTNTDARVPFHTWYNYSYTQQIYTAAEINHGAGNISKIAFNTSGTSHSRVIKVYMQNTTKDSFSSNSDWSSILDSELVFDGTVTTTASMEIELTTPFAYTGGNILLCIQDCTNQCPGATSFDIFQDAEGANCTLIVLDDNAQVGPDKLTGMELNVSNLKNVISLTFNGSSETPGEGGEEPEPTPEPEQPGGEELASEFSFDFEDGTLTGLRAFAGEGSNAPLWAVTNDSYYSNGTNVIFSESYDGAWNTYPSINNYIVTENAYTITAESKLSWYVRNADYNVAYADVYEVVVSEDGETFTQIWSGTAEMGVYEKELSLAESAGKNLYIGFRHYCTDELGGAAIVLDNIVLTAGEGGGEEPTPEPEPEPTPVAPAAPVVEATATETAITLTWDAVENATYYNIYTPNNYTGSNVYGLEATTYTFEGLTAGTEYCFEVAAVNDVDESESTEICATTTEAEIEEPTGDLCIVDFTLMDSYNDSWEQSYLLVSYGEVSEQFTCPRSESPKTYTLEIPQGANVTVTYTRGATAYPTENSFIIKYESGKEILNVAQGTLTETTSYDFTVDCTPAVPEKPVVVAKTTGESTIELEITAIGADSYTIYQGTEVVAEGLTAETYTVEGLTPDAEYCFTVKSVNEVGESEVSEVACATTYIEGTAVVQIGSGTESSYLAPVYDYYPYSISQTIYTAEEIGYGAGIINSISFNQQSGGGNTRNIAVYLKNTDKADLIAGWETLTSDLCVYDGSFTFATSGWVTIELQEQFLYEGDNLLVCVVDRTGSYQYVYEMFYLYPTGTVRCASGYSSSVMIDPLNITSYKTPLYSSPQIEFVIEPAAADVNVSLETIAFGEVQIGEYWSEKEATTVGVTVKSIATTITSITCDNDFFVLPTEIDYTANKIELEIAYNRNGSAGEQTGNLTITYGDGATKVVPMTATAYAPVTPDVFELAQEITFAENAYTDTPVFANLKDDYNLPKEANKGNTPDAVYTFTLEKEMNVTVGVNGTNAIAAIYKEDFDGKDGPRANNNYKGNVPAPTAPTTCFYDFGGEDALDAFTLIDKDGDGHNWELLTGTVASFSWKSGINALTPENYIYTKDVYAITSTSKLLYKVTGANYPDHYAVIISEDGENFEKVFEENTSSSGEYIPKEIDLSTYADRIVHIGLLHYDCTNQYYVSIDDLQLTDGNITSSVEPLISAVPYPAGKYYLVAAAEDAFTVNVAIEALETEEPVVPAAPVVAVDTVTETTVTLTWATVEGATSYNVYSADTLVENVKETTYTVEGLTAETEYTFVVKSVNEVGESEASNVVTAKTLAAAPVGPTVPAAPVLTVTVSYDTIQVRWEPVAGATSYRLYYKGELQDEFEDPALDIQVPTQGKYCFNITAVNEVGESEPAEACADVVAPEGMVAPAAPVLNATLDGDTVVLSWSAVEFGTYYNVYLLTPKSEMPYQYLGTSKGTSLKLQLEAKGEYCFFVTAQNLVGESKESNTACVNYGEGVEENVATFNIYPNPVSDKLVIETEATIEAVTIYSLTGVMVYAEVDFNNNMIDVTDFASGVYFIKVRTENGEAVQRFIKK